MTENGKAVINMIKYLNNIDITDVDSIPLNLAPIEIYIKFYNWFL